MQEKLTIKDIEQWIDNDEGLYSWWKSTRLSKREFIKQEKPAIVPVIRRILDGEKPAHYLKYGG